VLDAAGVVAFLENQAQNSVAPLEEIARGGYRLMVPGEELNMALAVLSEARANPLREGEQLTQRTFIFLSLVLMAVAFVFMPLRTRRWS
jgi:hypothetical protein